MKPSAFPSCLAALIAVILGVAGGCERDTSRASPRTASVPLDQAILGEWVIVCRTDAESTSTCLGKETTIFHKTFEPGGSFESRAVGGSSMTGRWTLAGADLDIVFEGGGMRVAEAYRARVEDGKLVLWYPSGEFGSIYARVGERFVPPPSTTTTGSAQIGELGGVRYSLALPANYRLARDDNNRQRWDPISGEGLMVRVSVSPRSQRLEGEIWVTEPCEPVQRPLSIASASEADQLTSVGTWLCVPNTEVSIACHAEHTRGHLEADERSAAEAICQTLDFAR